MKRAYKRKKTLRCKVASTAQCSSSSLSAAARSLKYNVISSYISLYTLQDFGSAQHYSATAAAAIEDAHQVYTQAHQVKLIHKKTVINQSWHSSSARTEFE